MKIDLRDRPVLIALDEPERRLALEAIKKLRDDYFMSCRADNRTPDQKYVARIDSLVALFQ